MSMRKWGFLLLLALPVLTFLTACSGGSGQNAGDRTTSAVKSRFDTVKARGKLVCGVSGELPGFSFVDKNGKYAGLDVDVCRAIAVAIFDNPDAVEYRNLNAKERFTALQAGEVDVLSRNTSWTISRDTSNGLEFAPVVLYDGQGIMVRQNSQIKSLKELKDKSICTQSGTTNEQNLSDRMRQEGIPYKPVVFEEINAAYAAYSQGRCQAVTSDRSQLVSRRSTLPKPAEHVILDAVLSKEPLAPAVTNGDSKWFDLVKWVVYSLISAEELGVTSKNVDGLANSTNPEIKRFLGKEGTLGSGLGVSNDFGAKIIKKIGNYGEIYDRNLGAKTPLNLPRGQNNLWNKGGLMYAPPFR
jgi:general L-amino acid transport system substrate-binding protein